MSKESRDAYYAPMEQSMKRIEKLREWVKVNDFSDYYYRNGGLQYPLSEVGHDDERFRLEKAVDDKILFYLEAGIDPTQVEPDKLNRMWGDFEKRQRESGSNYAASEALNPDEAIDKALFSDGDIEKARDIHKLTLDIAEAQRSLDQKRVELQALKKETE